MWCPKCKTEYREGIKICVDCGTELVEGTEQDFDVVDICQFKDEKVAERFIEFLNYSGIQGAKMTQEEKGIFNITVPTALEKKAEKLFRGFLLAETEAKETREAKAEEEKDFGEDNTEETGENKENIEEDEVDETENTDSNDYDWDAENAANEEDAAIFDSEDEIHKKADNLVLTDKIDEDTEDLVYSNEKPYVTKDEEYRDLKFSGITFIIFGLIGVSYLIMCQQEVFPIRYNMLVLVILSIMFGLFIVIGIVSLVKSAKVKLLIPAEETKTQEILQWLSDSLTPETIQSWSDDSVSESENDLLISAHIRASLIKKYPEESVAYLEMITEDYFEEHFVENNQSSQIEYPSADPKTEDVAEQSEETEKTEDVAEQSEETKNKAEK